jgi:hypothetical protein
MSTPPPTTSAVCDISGWDAEEIEEMGARDKVWVRSNSQAALPTHLWKAARSRGALPEYGTDSCAEYLTVRIARLIGVETAHVELAIRRHEHGVISARIHGELRHGNELLSGLLPAYETDRRGPVPGYELNSIQTVLNAYRGWSGDLSAFDCFVGLLVFDALVGNTDRHHENWAVLQDTQTLAPSFDHGASLGFNATIRQMSDAIGYARKATARHFGRRMTPLAVAQESLTMVAPDVSEMWIQRVASVESTRIRQMMRAIPIEWMSVPRRTFVVHLIEENRRRLLT